MSCRSFHFRRGIDEDLADAALIAKRFRISGGEVRAVAEATVAASLEGTTPFHSEHIVDWFRRILELYAP